MVAAFLLALAGAEDAPVPPPVLLRSFGRGEGNYRGAPCVADITGDGAPEIIVVRWNELLVYSATGGTVWTFPFKVRCYSGAVVGDVNGDGMKEVVLGDNQGNVYVLNGSGRLLQGWPQKVRMNADVRSVACADVDADGLDEVVAFSTLTDSGCEPNMYVYEGDGKVKDGWPHYHPADPYLGAAYDHAGGFNSNLAVGDLDGDGKLECIFPQDYGSVSVFHADGTPVWVHNRFRSHGKGKRVHWGEVRAWPDSQRERVKWGGGRGRHFLEFTYSPATIADIDLDGRPEVIVVPNAESTKKVGPIVGSALGVYNMDRTIKQGFDPLPLVLGAITGEGNARVEANPVAVAGDIVGDPRREVIVSHVDGTCRAYDFTGKAIWSVKVLPGGDCAISEPLIADVTRDGKADVIVLSSNAVTCETELLVIDGKGRKRLSFRMPFYTLSSPTLADVNGDGVPELICGARAEKSRKIVFVYSWPVVNPGRVVWPTARGDFGHTAWLREPEKRVAAEEANEAGGSVWALIAEKERARLQPEDPRLEEAKALARSGELEKAAGLYSELGAAELAGALREAGELRRWVTDGAPEGKSATTYVDVGGVRMRGKVVSADEDGVTVACMGNEMKVSWAEFSPKRLIAIARQYAKGDPERERLLETLARACGLEGG